MPLPAYIDSWTWERREEDALSKTSDWLGGLFAEANAAYVHQLAIDTGASARVHAIFNIGADALQDFVLTDDYKNVYERPVVAGKALTPSATRERVDKICLDQPANHYFCALAIGGTGMRFYGEYCVVLGSPLDKAVELVLDRNSFDFEKEPLGTLLRSLPLAEQQRLARNLMCKFRSKEMGCMLSIKVLQHHSVRPRLFTMGSVGDALLADEDYLEAFHCGKIRLRAVLEVRSHPDDEVTESSIEKRHSQGELLPPEETQWVGRRQQARRVMTGAGLRHRVVTGNGRGLRWR